LREDVELQKLTIIDADRAIAHVRVGGITIKSIWIVGIAAGSPRTSWPETGKGYPIVEATPDLKARIDDLILVEVRGDGPLLKAKPKVKKARTRSKAKPSAGGFYSDPLPPWMA